MNYFAIMVAFFLIPLVMIICGMSYTKRGPKHISRAQGYRSRMSMKNRETWDFAHKYLGDLWFKLGTPMLAISSVAALIIFRGSDRAIMIACTVFILLDILLMVIPVYFTEKALKANFDENGKWRSKEAKEKWQELDTKRKKQYNHEE